MPKRWRHGLPRQVAYRHEKIAALKKAGEKLAKAEQEINPDTLSTAAAEFLTLKVRTFRAFIYNDMTPVEKKSLGLRL